MNINEIKPLIKDEHFEDFFTSIVDQSETPIAFVDEPGNFLYVNQSLCNMLGYSPGFLLSIKWQDITHPEDIDADRKSVSITRKGIIKNYSMSKRYRHKLGNYVESELRVYRIPEHGDFSFFISIIAPLPEIVNVKPVEGEPNKYRVVPRLEDLWADNKLKLIILGIFFLIIVMVFEDLTSLTALIEAIKK